jgi:hypothetical protein
MNHVIAVLCLAVACIVWFLIQRASGRLDEAECEEDEAHCDDCASRTDRCPSAEPGRAEPAPRRHVRIF